MTSLEPGLPAAPVLTGVTPGTHAPSSLRVWALHAFSLALPLYTLLFLISGPHRWYGTLPWLAVVPGVWLLDRHGGRAEHEPAEGAPAWPFDVILLVLGALQIANVTLLLRLVTKTGALAVDVPVAILLVGVNSGYSAIVVAHELVHRKHKALYTLGRLLLCSVLYEHFTTEHVRGHHKRVGTEEDPATARYGESYKAFWRRTVPAQLRSAWRIECARLGDPDMRWYDLRQTKNAVLHGALVEAALIAVLIGVGGMLVAAVFVYQAYIAVRLLEAVNYFEHYGLQRRGKKVRPVDSWDSDSRFTLFALVGLSRHADHHAYAARPFQTLRTWDESPKLPSGYIVTAVAAMFDNERLRRRLHAELARRGLGPDASQRKCSP